MRGRGHRPVAMRGGVDGAWPPHGGQALPRSGAARRVSGQARAEAGQARRWAGLGRGEARGAVGGWLGRLRSWAESEAAAREGENPFFICIFKEFLNANFQTLF